MTNLNKKNIILGISGSIAAYKTPELVRRLREQGCRIRVVMTKSAKYFVAPISLQVVSGHPIEYEILDISKKSVMNHIRLAKWADLILIAPATANLLACLAIGISNDLLTILCMATEAPLIIVPSMNKVMYQSSATQRNLKILKKRGAFLLGPDNGIQACGDIGEGRMLDPLILVNYISKFFSQNKPLSHLNIMVTAGPTQEAIDPVRFISNHSSGKMGFAIANVAASQGAKVTLIAGPVFQPTPENVRRINVISAVEMKNAVMRTIHKQHIFIGCAAVSDYRIKHVSSRKIKNCKNSLSITLIKNPDITAIVGSLKKNRPYVVGFAAETDNIKEYARKERIDKHIDLICANDVSKYKQGFNSDNNALYLIWKNGEIFLPLNNKIILAQELINRIISQYNEKSKC